MHPSVYVAGWITSALSGVASALLQGYNAAKDFPWRKIFAWSVVAGVVYYFFGMLWYAFKSALFALRWVAQSGNFSAGPSPESGLLGTSINLSSFWSILSLHLPDFWRYFMYFFALDWFIFLGVNILHMKVIGWIVDRLLTALAKTIHSVFNHL